MYKWRPSTDQLKRAAQTRAAQSDNAAPCKARASLSCANFSMCSFDCKINTQIKLMMTLIT